MQDLHPICLCVNSSAVTGICFGIAAFFAINLVVFIYFSGTKQTLEMTVGQSSTSEASPPAEVGDVELSNIASKEEGELVADGPVPQSELDDQGENAASPPQKKKRGVIRSAYVLVGLMAYVFIPIIDNLTDLAFLLSNEFFSPVVMILFAFFFCSPGLFFYKTLIDKNAHPKFYICPMPECLLWKEYNSLWKVIAGSIIVIPFIILNSPFLFPWLLVGNLLFGTKAFAVRPVANLWLHIWTGRRFAAEGTPEAEEREKDIAFAKENPIDAKVLNESLLSHFIGETLPILVIQVRVPLLLHLFSLSSFSSLSNLF